eukprot:111970-Alexandrium_andersonii.AAC.1
METRPRHALHIGSGPSSSSAAAMELGQRVACQVCVAAPACPPVDCQDEARACFDMPPVGLQGQGLGVHEK